MHSKYAHLYLGYSYDPQPVFRDMHPDAHNWPDGATFAVTIKEIELMGKDIRFHPCLERTEFFGSDGWPLDFPADRKDAFFNKNSNGATFYRGLFQRYPLTSWRSWNIDDWEQVRIDYQRRMCNDIDWMTKTQFSAKRCHVDEKPVYEHLRRYPPPPASDKSPTISPLMRIARFLHLACA